MTEREDAKVAARYRALATEEPSAVLDDALRAAARRAVSSAPGGFRASRWAVPASIAAVLMLSFGVVLRMQQEQPGVESSLPAREAVPATPLEVPKETLPRAELPGQAPASQPAPVPKAMPAQKPVPAEPEKKVATDSAPGLQQKRMAAAAPTPAPPAAPPALAAPSAFPAAEPRRDSLADKRNESERMLTKERAAAPPASLSAPAPRAKAEAGESAGASALGRVAPETPEKALERIAELRRTGRDKEADEALVKFRREHPDYKIPAEIWERVRPR